MCRKSQLNILHGYLEIFVQKIKVKKSLLNFNLQYLLSKSPDNYILG